MNMKVIVVVLLGGFLFVPYSFADTLGEFGKISLGVETEFVTRDMENSKSNYSSVEYLPSSTVYDSGVLSNVSDADFDSVRAMATLGVGLLKNLDLALSVGVANVYVDGITADAWDSLAFDGDADFAWGAGLKWDVFKVQDYSFTVNADYLSYETDGKFSSDGQDYSVVSSPGDSRTYSSKTKVWEWEVGVEVSRKFGRFTPYLGVNYSDSSIKNSLSWDYFDNGSLSDSGTLDLEFEQENNFGVSAGFSFDFSDSLSLAVDGNFLSETSVKALLAWRF